jgi:hypothetical protein
VLERMNIATRGCFDEKTPAGAAYLCRCRHRVAISNRRLVAADDASIAFCWKDYRKGAALPMFALRLSHDRHRGVRAAGAAALQSKQAIEAK